MKRMSVFLSVLASTVSASALAASISFSQPAPPPGVDGPIMATAAGISGLERATKAEGTFQIKNDGAGRVVNTNVAITDVVAGVAQLAQGAIGWSAESPSADTYTITFSAGGFPGRYDPKQVYCMAVSIDGNSYGSNCSSPSKYWDPTVVHKVPMTQGSTITVTFSYK